jgi:hypothetical protein
VVRVTHVHFNPEENFNALQRQNWLHKFVEIGKLLLSWTILKNEDMVSKFEI